VLSADQKFVVGGLAVEEGFLGLFEGDDLRVFEVGVGGACGADLPAYGVELSFLVFELGVEVVFLLVG
jgi:hypothetical protein